MTGKLPALMVAQSGGPTAAINASLAGVVETALDDSRIGRVLGARFGVEGLLRNDVIDLDTVGRDVWQRIKLTPSAALGPGSARLLAETERR